MKALTTLLVVGMFLTTVAVADDVDDVKAAVQKNIAAVNAGDAEGRTAGRSPDWSTFNRGGALLARTASVEAQKKAFQASVDAGVKRNYRLQHLEVKVYGDAAVVTSYLVGTQTAPNGDIARWADRRTAVWVKQGGQWREAHLHQSPIRLPQ